MNLSETLIDYFGNKNTFGKLIFLVALINEKRNKQQQDFASGAARPIDRQAAWKWNFKWEFVTLVSLKHQRAATRNKQKILLATQMDYSDSN